MSEECLIQEKTQARYAKESAENNNLSCGGNLDFLNIKPGEHILDLGCGRGNETIAAAIKTGPEGFAAGLDLTPEMVDKAAECARTAKVSNVLFVQGEMEKLPFEDNSFNAVVSNCAINHAKNKQKVYEEIFRVLKDGGRFVVSDAVSKLPLPPKIKDDPEAWADCFGGAVTEEAYLEAIRSPGFKDIKIIKKREYLKFGYEFASLTIQAFKGR